MIKSKRQDAVFDLTARKYGQYEFEDIADVDTYSFMKSLDIDFKDKIIADVGCGLGEISLWFILKGAKKVISIDSSIGSLISAKNYILKKIEGKKPMFIRAKMPKLPFGAPIFDIVFSHGVMSYVDDFNKALMSLRDIVKPDGEIIVSFVKRHKYDPLLDILRIPCSLIPVSISKYISNILAVVFYPFAPLFIGKKPSLTRGYTLDRTFFEMIFVRSYKTSDRDHVIKILQNMGMEARELSHPDRKTNFVLRAKLKTQ